MHTIKRNVLQLNPSTTLVMLCLHIFQLATSTRGNNTTLICSDVKARSCEAICLYPSDLCTIRVLVLLPDNERYVASLQRVLPILHAAEQQVHKIGLLPPHVKFTWMLQDDKCDAAFAMIKAMDGIFKNCAHVIFGPVCDYPLAAVGRIIKYFSSQGTPLITVGGATYDFENKKTDCGDEFYMLVRAGMLSFETISELTITVMKSYNWRNSIFFYDRNGQENVAGLHTCFLMMNSLGKQMRKENMSFAQYPIDMTIKNRTTEMITEIGNKHTNKNVTKSAEVKSMLNKKVSELFIDNKEKQSQTADMKNVNINKNAGWPVCLK